MPHTLQCRTRPRLSLETDPFSVNNYKIVLYMNSDLIVSYKSPISRDFRLYFKSRTQVRFISRYFHFSLDVQSVTVAVFSEAEGNLILAGLEKAGASLRAQGEAGDCEVTLRGDLGSQSRREKIYRRLSSSSWLRSPLPKREETASAVWYFNNYQEDAVFDDDVSSIDQSIDFSLADTDTTMSTTSSVFGTLPRGRKQRMEDSIDGHSLLDGSLHSYFSLPRRLFRSDVNLYKSGSQANLRADKNKVLLPHDWQDEDKLEPGLFGLLEDPGVLRLDFTDYPDSVYVTDTGDHMDCPDLDITGNKDWIRKSYDELDVDTNRTDIEIVYNRTMSQSTGDIAETVNNDDYFEYVLQRFETELPGYEEALVQNGLKQSRRPRILRFEGNLSFESTL